MRGNMSLPQWMWWDKNACVVEILRTGHFPTTVMVQLPDDRVTEVDIEELVNAKGKE